MNGREGLARQRARKERRKRERERERKGRREGKAREQKEGGREGKATGGSDDDDIPLEMEKHSYLLTLLSTLHYFTLLYHSAHHTHGRA